MADAQTANEAPIEKTAEPDPLVARRDDVTRDMLRDGIRILQPAERDALRLATRDRLPVSAIADRLALHSSEVESHLRTGLIALRQSLLVQLGERTS